MLQQTIEKIEQRLRNTEVINEENKSELINLYQRSRLKLPISQNAQ